MTLKTYLLPLGGKLPMSALRQHLRHFTKTTKVGLGRFKQEALRLNIILSMVNVSFTIIDYLIFEI